MTPASRNLPSQFLRLEIKNTPWNLETPLISGVHCSLAGEARSEASHGSFCSHLDGVSNQGALVVECNPDGPVAL